MRNNKSTGKYHTNESLDTTIRYYNTEQYACFKRLHPGDVIFAKMPLSNEMLLEIEESHRSRLFLVARKDRTYVYGYQCSSSLMPWLKSYEYHPYRQSIYHDNKDSYFQLNCYYKIPIDYIERYLTTLYYDDCYEIQRKLLMCENHHQSKVHFKIDVSLRLGDIFIKNGKLYLIYQSDHSNHYAFRTYEIIRNHAQSVEADGFYFGFNFNDRLILKKNEYYSLYYHFNYDQLYQAEAIRKKVKRSTSKKALFKLERGMKLLDSHDMEYIYLFTNEKINYALDLKQKEIVKMKHLNEFQPIEMLNQKLLYHYCLPLYSTNKKWKKELNQLIDETSEKGKLCVYINRLSYSLYHTFKLFLCKQNHK